IGRRPWGGKGLDFGGRALFKKKQSSQVLVGALRARGECLPPNPPRLPGPPQFCGWNLSSSRVVFFQAEDGIRDLCVTGVQTCALPISWLPQFRYQASVVLAEALWGPLSRYR